MIGEEIVRKLSNESDYRLKKLLEISTIKNYLTSFKDSEKLATTISPANSN